MIVRILNEGQWELDDAALAELNKLDDLVDQAVTDEDADRLTAALHELHERVRGTGRPVPDDDLRDSDLILPEVDSTLDDVRALLNESDQGLIPN